MLKSQAVDGSLVVNYAFALSTFVIVLVKSIRTIASNIPVKVISIKRNTLERGPNLVTLCDSLKAAVPTSCHEGLAVQGEDRCL